MPIKEADMQKLQNIKDGYHKDLKSFDNFEAQSKYISKYLNQVKLEYSNFIKLKAIDLKAKFPVVLKHNIMLRDYLSLSDDTNGKQRMEVIVKALQKTWDKFSSGEITKISDLKSTLTSIGDKLNKVVQDETAVERLNENKSAFSSLKKVKLGTSKDMLSTVTAPIMFTGYTNKSDTEKLIKYLGLKNLAGYNIIPSAKFIVLDLTKSEKIKSSKEGIINKHLMIINKNLGRPVAALHDISTTIRNKYVVFVIPEISAKYIASFMDNVDDFEIFLN